MRDRTFFTRPALDWQRRYEALRASFVEKLPAKTVAERFGYSAEYVRLLRHLFLNEKLDFTDPVPEGKAARRAVTTEIRKKIRAFREKQLSASEISRLLSKEGRKISVRTVERVLAEEGFARLPRRTRVQRGRTVKGAEIPERSERVLLEELDGKRLSCSAAGVFLFTPFLAQLDIHRVVEQANLPGSKVIPAISYLHSFLALKLLGTERYAHANDHGFDLGLGLFAGLNVLPKCTAMSTYSYSLDEVQLLQLQQAFIRQASNLGLYEGNFINLDFHTVPHFGEESVLEEHWAGARGKRMKGALTLFAQDAGSKLILYSSSDILREEANDQVLSFLSFWNSVYRGMKPMLIFDSRFTTYPILSELNSSGIKFITLRRRGKNLMDKAERLSGWKRIHLENTKRKYPNPQVHESTIQLRGYEGELRQLIVRGTGREKPSFIITNDFDIATEQTVGGYGRRWRIENGIAEAVKFFNLNCLSSPILVKVHFDVTMTMIADTLYSMLAQKLRGFEGCDAPKLYRHFVRGKGMIFVDGREITVVYPRRAHNPILRAVPWRQMPDNIPSLPASRLSLRFQ
jgi:transposase